jgi:phosphate uptake regulator
MFKNLVNLFNRDNLYQQALQKSHDMLDMDLMMYDASVTSLRQSDNADIDIDIYKMDKELNSFERDVRQKVMTHLAISGGSDLTAGLILVSVVIDIERIGDYTKDIYTLASKHPTRLSAGSLEERLQDIEKRVGNDFRDMIGAFKNSDEDKARTIMENYKDGLSAACENLVLDVVSGKVTDLSPQDATTVALYTRYLKRIAGHSRNVITSVVNPFPRLGYKEKKEV